MRKDHSRLTLQKIDSFRLKFKTEGVVDDGSDIFEPSWEESNEMKSSQSIGIRMKKMISI